MKYFVLLFTFLFVGSLSACEKQKQITKSKYSDWDERLLVFTDRKAQDPTRYEIIKAMLDHPDIVAKKMATVISNCAESEKDNVKIEVGFEEPLYDSVNKFIVWHVWVAFQCNEPENEIFYACGMGFFIRDDTRKAIIETFRDYGTC